MSLRKKIGAFFIKMADYSMGFSMKLQDRWINTKDKQEERRLKNGKE